MYQVTQPGLYHTAGADGLPGIDFGGKTGTAQVMSHQALDKTNKNRATNPNVWFVGVTPTRNPELVVAVLWQNGGFSYYPARIGARVVAAYIEKQRRIANNLVPSKQPAPTEMGAVWTEPLPPSTKGAKADATRLNAGHFLVGPGGNLGDILTSRATKPPAMKPGANRNSAKLRTRELKDKAGAQAAKSGEQAAKPDEHAVSSAKANVLRSGQ
jgi:membrane peptidoglycan carboxypeptidase